MVIMIVAVLGALGSAGVFMMRRRQDGDASKEPDRHMARALALRVALSVALFLIVLVSWRMGWVRPNGIPIGS